MFLIIKFLRRYRFSFRMDGALELYKKRPKAKKNTKIGMCLAVFILKNMFKSGETTEGLGLSPRKP